jgi:hypothetical protein
MTGMQRLKGPKKFLGLTLSISDRSFVVPVKQDKPAFPPQNAKYGVLGAPVNLGPGALSS